MRAVVYYGAGDIRIEERPQPTPKEDNMIARVDCCALCGSDLKMWKSGNPRCKPPRIIGHEVACTLVHIGHAVSGYGYAVGDRVTLATTVGCGTCDLCRSNRRNLCRQAQPISNASDGAFAAFMEIPFLAIVNGHVIKIPDALPSEWAALCEPLSCAVNAQSNAPIGKDATVLIIGGGPLGALHAELAKAYGAKKVIIAEISSARLALLRALDKVLLIDAANEDIRERVMAETDQRGADLVILCAPSAEAHGQALEFVKKGGHVCLFASLPLQRAMVSLNSRTIHYNELTLYGVSDSRPEHVREAVRLLSEGYIAADRLITHRLGLEDFFTGLDMMEKGVSLKVLIDPKK